MKEFRNKLANLLAIIFGIGIAVALFGGAISVFGYLAAIMIGGSTATAICEFIYKQIYPILIYISSCSVLIGLLKMYVAGEKTMVPQRKK